jgi:two-component SAPR family response regulator
MQKIIMAVDDETSVLRSLNRIFKSRHYEFHPFESPVEALAALKRIRPHVIISDHHMPHIHGDDFLSKAKTISQRSLRIILTGIELRGKGNKRHIDRIMPKPWIPEELESEIMNTTVHKDKIFVPVTSRTGMDESTHCCLCGNCDISHEIRFDDFSECVCTACRSKLMSYAGTSLESMLINTMIGNVC